MKKILLQYNTKSEAPRSEGKAEREPALATGRLGADAAPFYSNKAIMKFLTTKKHVKQRVNTFVFHKPILTRKIERDLYCTCLIWWSYKSLFVFSQKRQYFGIPHNRKEKHKFSCSRDIIFLFKTRTHFPIFWKQNDNCHTTPNLSIPVDTNYSNRFWLRA
jgi:hypothetical protein